MTKRKRMTKAAKAAARKTRDMTSISNVVILAIEGAILLFGKPNGQIFFKDVASVSVFERLKSKEFEKIPETLGAVYSSPGNAALAIATPPVGKFIKKNLPKVKLFGLVKT